MPKRRLKVSHFSPWHNIMWMIYSTMYVHYRAAGGSQVKYPARCEAGTWTSFEHTCHEFVIIVLCHHSVGWRNGWVCQNSASVRATACHADIGEMEKLVRSITQDGLVWGACESVMCLSRVNTCDVLTMFSQACARGVWHQETADQLCGGGWQNRHRFPRGDYYSFWRSCKPVLINKHYITCLIIIVLCRFRVWTLWPSTKYKFWALKNFQ